MVCRCVVRVCPNSYQKTRSKNPDLKFYPFPSNECIRNKWIRACQQNENWILGSSSFICSIHFLTTDFERDLKAELMNLPPKKTLKPDAVPSLFLTVKEVRDLEITQRKQKFFECLRKHNEYSVESDQSLLDVVFSTFGVPKILISASAEEFSKENQIQKSIGEAKSQQSVTDSSSSSESNFGSHKTIFNLKELCRFCGSYSDCVKTITNDRNFDYFELIQEYLPSIQIDENDLLPQIMCSRCENSLISWYQFLKTCSSVDQKFQSIVRSFSEKKAEECKNEIILSETLSNLEPNRIDNKKLQYLDASNLIEEVEKDCQKEDKFSGSDSDTISVLPDDFTFEISELSKPVRKKRKRVYKSPVICDICHKSFRCPYTRKIHMRTVHTSERPFFCNVCNASFKRKDHLQCHVSMVHDRIVRPSQRNARRPVSVTLLCAECGKVFRSKNSYRAHNDSIHNNIKKYHCEQCNLSFNRYSKLYHHRVVLKHAKNEFLKACRFCGLEFQSEIYYIRHMTKHEEVLNCEKCCVEFGSNQEFQDHVSKFHCGNKAFVCDSCPKKFTSKTSLFQHKKLHMDEKEEKPFKCEYCNWRFRNRGHLSVHLHRHTGERPYVCSLCNKGFKQKGDMRKHKALHLLIEKKSYSEVDVNVDNVL